MGRRSIAVLCLATLLFAVAIPVTAVLAYLPEEWGVLDAARPDSDSRALALQSTSAPVLRVLASSRHLARAALPSHF
jgi:hypothetical protein